MYKIPKGRRESDKLKKKINITYTGITFHSDLIKIVLRLEKNVTLVVAIIASYCPYRGIWSIDSDKSLYRMR